MTLSASNVTVLVPPDLLIKLAADAARLAAVPHFLAFTETIRTERVGLFGRTNVREVERRVEGDVRTVVRCSENGRDLPGERGRTSSRQSTTKTSSPFAEGAQRRHRFESLGRDATRPELLRIRVEPAGEAGPDVLRGEALVDERAGTLFSFSLSPTVLPPFVERIVVNQRLETITPQGRVPSSGGSDVTVSFLALAKIHLRSVTAYSDYAVIPPAASSPR